MTSVTNKDLQIVGACNGLYIYHLPSGDCKGMGDGCDYTFDEAKHDIAAGYDDLMEAHFPEYASKIYLRNIEGIVRLSGEDENGCRWEQFEVDHLAEQQVGKCHICGAELESGWLCLDGGDEVCDEHVTYKENEE